MYRNCVYNNKTRSVHLWTWDAHGNRIKQELDFKPYLYLEDKKGTDKSIYDSPVKLKEFDTLWDRNKFVKDSGVKRLFENLPPYQQFLIDNYYLLNERDDFSQFPLKLMFLDIECPSNDGFPHPDEAKSVINLITCYDNFSKIYTQFGLKAQAFFRDDIEYHHCKSEKDLLKRFINQFSSDYPDAVVTFNGADFDIPYLINRITFELDKEWADELSPVGRIYEKINNDGKFGMPTKQYVIEGISSLDYYVMYNKFATEKLESYKLDYIAEYELEERKVDYDGTLWDLARDDWKTYCEYNFVDVEILVKLDQKLKYIDLLRFISYLGLCNMENAIRTLPVINGAVAVRARHRGVKIPTFVRIKNDEKIPGGHVAYPKIGFAKNIVSFDANSLYPSVMISLNMSPETKLGRVEVIGDKYEFNHVSGRTYTLSKEQFVEYLQSENASISKAKILFSQKRKGLMPEFLDYLYDKRKEMKGNMLKLKKIKEQKKAELDDHQLSELEAKIQEFDTFQNAYKITLNSTYGYCANKYAPMGDDEVGASVTLTGQAVIKKSNECFVELMCEKFPEMSSSKAESYIRYNDTDSIYLSFNDIDKYGVELLKDGKISYEFETMCNEIEAHMNINMCEWSKKELRANDPRFAFKRESICDNGIFVSKKYYVLHTLNVEGVDTNEYKYTGVDVVKTTMPKGLKPLVKDIIESMCSTQDKKEPNEKFSKCFDYFKTLGVDTIYKNCGVNKYEKYVSKADGFKVASRTPGHVKAAYYHDLIIDKLGLGNKYQKFKSGDKVKQVYVKPMNKFGIDIIGFKGKYPKEFEEIFQVDYERMFELLLYKPMDRIYKPVNWVLRKPTESVKIELEDYLS